MQIFFSIVLYSMSLNSSAQSVGIGTTTPAASAMLQINSTTKGLLTPRVTTAQRIAIVSPANGLLLYDTNSNSFWFYKSNTWIELAAGSGSTTWTSNSNDIYNNNSGAVGIGTALPVGTAKLTIETADYTTASVVRNTSGTAVLQTYIVGNANNNIVSMGTPGDMPLALYTNSANRLFINSGGDIGVGTDNPGNKLEVIGKIGASATAMSVTGPLGFNGGVMSLRNTNGNGHTLTIDGSGIQGTSFDGINSSYRAVSINPFGGNVGIGTANPEATAKTTIQTAEYSTALVIRNTTGSAVLQAYVGGPVNNNVISLGTPGAMPLALYSNAANRIFISASGNIGIATDMPNAKLEVNGSVSLPIRTIATAGAYNFSDDDYTIIADAVNLTNSNIDMLLPAATGRKGRIYNVAAINLPTNFSSKVRIFNGGVLVTQLFKNEFFGFSPFETNISSRTTCTIQSNGSQWFIVSSDYYNYTDTH